MPSKRLLPLILTLAACVAQAASPGAVFEKYRDGILSGAMARADGVCFAVGTARAVSSSKQAREAAPRKAALEASATLIQRLATERLVWPKELSGPTRQTLQDLLFRLLNVEAAVSGLVTVHSEETAKGIWRAVVALPEGVAGKVPRVSFEEARQMLLQEGVVSRAEGKALDALIALRGTLGKMPAAVERGPWEELLAAAEFGTPRLAALPRLAGRYPLGSAETPADADFTRGNEAFGKGDLEAAYAAFLASAGRAWTFDALNMAGNVARRLPGHEAEAVALLLHAAYLKPSSPYPWVHLAFVASREGDPALAEACCAKAETLGTGDAWVREQVAAVRKTLAPPASTQDASSRDAKVEQEAHP